MERMVVQVVEVELQVHLEVLTLEAQVILHLLVPLKVKMVEMVIVKVVQVYIQTEQFLVVVEVVPEQLGKIIIHLDQTQQVLLEELV
tara:strand:- start:117 stop:377 length:261 start_codon:yes stop_codon:yes gene_type:complete